MLLANTVMRLALQIISLFGPKERAGSASVSITSGPAEALVEGKTCPRVCFGGQAAYVAERLAWSATNLLCASTLALLI